MDNKLKSALNKNINTILDKLPKEFDTHAFINAFLNLNDNNYVNLLSQHKEAQAPFKAFHGIIARYMNTIEKNGLIEKVIVDGKKKRVRSLNIKMNQTYNQVWKKR